MAATTKTWVDNSAPTLNDDDLNGFKNENNNLIEGAGQVLSAADNQQTQKAVSIYASGGDFYSESGAADAYVLDVVGTKVAPPAYFIGMRIRFVAGNVNTGGAVTVNVDSLGVKTLVDDVTGAAPTAAILSITAISEGYYDGTDFRLVSSGQLFAKGVHTFAAVADGGLVEITTLAHGLGSDDIDFGFKIKGSVTSEAVGGVMVDVNDFRVFHMPNGALGVIPTPTAPAAGKLTAKVLNTAGAGIQDITVHWWARRR